MYKHVIIVCGLKWFCRTIFGIKKQFMLITSIWRVVNLAFVCCLVFRISLLIYSHSYVVIPSLITSKACQKLISIFASWLPGMLCAEPFGFEFEIFIHTRIKIYTFAWMAYSISSVDLRHCTQSVFIKMKLKNSRGWLDLLSIWLLWKMKKLNVLQPEAVLLKLTMIQCVPENFFRFLC